MTKSPKHFYVDLLNPALLVRHLNALIQERIWLKVLLGLVLGILTGLALLWIAPHISARTLNAATNWIGFPGKLFLALIQMIVIPLVFVSVVKGISSAQSIEQVRTLGARIGLYFLCSTAISVLIGFFVAKLIQPGRTIHEELRQAGKTQTVVDQKSVSEAVPIDAIPDMLVNLLPQNPLVSMTEGQMLQIVLFAMIIGFALLSIPSKQTEVFQNLLSSIQSICMTVVRWAMKLAPIAVFGLLAEATAKSGITTLYSVTSYVVTVVLGLMGVLGFYLVLVMIIGKRNPFGFLRSIKEVLLLAFSTSSSAAVMPLTLETAEQELKIDPKVSQFVIPLGTTINMDGTALYQGVATVFLAHTAGIDLDTGSLLLVVITAIGASIGSPGTPGVGIVILSGLLANLGVPASGIALILGVDRILDMCRTVINVAGDLTASTVMDRWALAWEGPLNKSNTQSKALKAQAP